MTAQASRVIDDEALREQAFQSYLPVLKAAHELIEQPLPDHCPALTYLAQFIEDYATFHIHESHISLSEWQKTMDTLCEDGISRFEALSQLIERYYVDQVLDALISFYRTLLMPAHRTLALTDTDPSTLPAITIDDVTLVSDSAGN